MKNLPLIVLFYSNSVFAQVGPTWVSGAEQQLSESEKLEQNKKLFFENTKNLIPNSYLENELSILKIDTPICDPKKMSLAIDQCTNSKCLNKIKIFGTSIFNEFFVHGPNKVGNCVISTSGRRFFVPKKDLARFSKIYLGNMQSSFSAVGTYGTDNSEITQVVAVDGRQCKINAKYRNDPDLTGAELLKFSPPKKDGIEVSTNNNKTTTIYSKDGKSYRMNSSTVNFVSKLLSYSLAKESETVCKNLGATIFFDLEKQGLTQNLTVRNFY